MQVFLVEDSALIRDRLAALLTAIPGTRIAGHAGDAKAAIRDILAAQPDVVVLDLSLASGNGFDVVRAVRPVAPHIDFYMLTNFAADQYRQLAYMLGVRGFFDKTREFERVREALAARATQAH